MIILVDFDGTITLQDVTNLIWDRYYTIDWRKEFLPRYWEGEQTHLQLMKQGYSHITATAEDLLEYAGSRVQLRPGLDGLQHLCEREGWPLVVVSGGIDFYLKYFLPPGLPFYCYRGELDGYWKLSLPPDIDLPPGADYKVTVLEKLRAEHPGQKVVFIGDGRNDLPVALHADRVFAVKDSPLAEMLAEKEVPRDEFTSFNEVSDALLKMKENG